MNNGFVLIHEDKGTTPPTVSNLVFASPDDAEAWLLSALSIVQRPVESAAEL